MKKNLLIIIIPVLLLCALLCACGDVSVTIDGVDPGASCAFGLTYSGNQGNAFSDSPQGNYPAGTEITAHAVPSDGSAFFCWTAGGTLEDGGVPVSYAKDYTFSITEDTWLFANFREHTSALVLYHANGGTVTADEPSAIETASADEYFDDFSLAYYLYPNSLAEMGNFAREGYVLVGYNTEPDGSGEFYNVGGKVFEDTDGVIELWCVWKEESPADDFSFEYDRSYGGWAVNSYIGHDEDVCIPASYNNEPVVGVASGAFSGNTDVKNLVFPSTIRYIRDYSCNSMTNLEAVAMFDSLDYVSDASFDGDASLTSCFFGAATLPRYSNWFNNHTKKIEIMNYWKDSDRPLMIILGGSSTTYAVDAEQLESLLDRDYLVLNCGSNGANLFNMTSRWAMHFLREGDFLLQIPEYSFWQFGGVECRWESFRSFESCYNIFSWVPVYMFTKYFDSFHDFLDARRSQTEYTYEDYVSNLAPNGYYDNQGTLTVVTKPNGSPTFWQGRSIGFYGIDYTGEPWFYDFMADCCNYQYAKLDEMGVDYAMAFTPLNRNSLTYEWQTDELIEEWEDYIASKLNIDIISDMQENILDPEVFFDDDYHLAAPARAEYTEHLAADLNAYFAAMDGKGE